MFGWFARYARWLHTQWPAGGVEALPEVRDGGRTNQPGVFVTGDLSGIPLLKFALDGGARVAASIADDPALRTSEVPAGTLDLVILGGGVSGMAAAIEAARRGLSYAVLEAAEPFFTVANFPRAKPIYTYPQTMTPAGKLQVSADLKETLLAELRAQTATAGIRARHARAERVEKSGAALAVRLEDGGTVLARRVIVALGRAGRHRRLGVPGEDREQVTHRLHDPHDFDRRRVLVVGGGDAAVETAIALAQSGADVTLCHRGVDFSRARPGNLEKLERLLKDPAADVSVEQPTSEFVSAASVPFTTAAHRPHALRVRLATTVEEIGEGDVALRGPDGARESVAADTVFVMIGREPPLDFFRRSGLAIASEMTPRRWSALGVFMLFCAWLYDLKSGGMFDRLFRERGWFPYSLPDQLHHLGGAVARAAADPSSLLGTLAISATGPSFWYTLAYSTAVVVFGIRRIQRRRTPYVTRQTWCLMAVQVIPLFLLPEIVLPLLDAHGLLPRGLADALFPVVSYGHGREFWRAYGLILAWPLDVYNLFTHEPLWAWIAIGFAQTCVLIPLLIYFFGKGAYCGWICSCGALAETLGDTHRHKMPHGPGWNRLNLVGQGVLAVAVALLIVRVIGWNLPAGNWADRVFEPLKEQYKWTVDVALAGVLGYGLYFWFSGRVWCRFACPLAALMNIYARFSRFRIVADKKKCISCSACTAICHQGIDVMSFANKGLPMADPQCVRCSACVHACPTGVLSFGQVDRSGTVISLDRLLASPVQIREGTAPR